MEDSNIEEIETSLDGTLVKALSPDMVEEPDDVGERILILKKGNKKTLSLAELHEIEVPDCQLYYGLEHPDGLVEVRRREARAGHKFHDYVLWYERVISVNSELRKLAYHVVHEPSEHELFVDYFYPCTQWNISNGLLNQQDHTPDWKKMFAMKDANTPFTVGRQRLKPFHFVVMNRRYRAIEVARGKKIDGVFVQCPPASGLYIKSFRAAIETLGGSAHGMDR
ncbi:hypothetical protein LCGC14_0578400, partial [marine sediment metagenome]